MFPDCWVVSGVPRAHLARGARRRVPGRVWGPTRPWRVLSLVAGSWLWWRFFPFGVHNSRMSLRPRCCRFGGVFVAGVRWQESRREDGRTFSFQWITTELLMKAHIYIYIYMDNFQWPRCDMTVYSYSMCILFQTFSLLILILLWNFR